MIRHLRAALLILLLFSLITGMLYPLAVTCIVQAVFPLRANGSVMYREGRPIGSELIGQEFHGTQYFWSRLSATSPTAYNAAASSGSNYGPLNPALLDAVKGRIAQLRKADPSNTQPVPADLVTASASGLDPHISVAAALYQLPCVALARSMSEQTVRHLIDQCTDSRDLGFLGENGVNVLKLNLALDTLTSRQNN